MVHIKSELNIFKYISLVAQVGLMMAIPIVGGTLLGNYLDKRLGTNFIFIIVFTLLGLLAAFRNLYKLSQREDINGNEDEKDSKK